MQDVTTRTHIIAVDHEAPRAGAGHPVPESAQPSWQAEVGDLLVRAAQACSQHGVDLDAFMQSAWSAYIGARPGLKEHLEELQLRTQLDELRRSGKVGTA